MVTIDTQVDTLDGQPLEIPGTSAAVPGIVALAAAFRDAGRPVVHVVRLYRRDGSNVDICRRSMVEAGAEILAPGSSGSQLAPEIVDQTSFELEADELLEGRLQQVGPGEVVIYKPRWGAFYETPLDDHLRRQDVSTIVFCGCNFPNCPRASIYEASERDFRVVLAEDAVSGLYGKGRDELESIGVRLMSTAEVVESVAGPAPSKGIGHGACHWPTPAWRDKRKAAYAAALHAKHERSSGPGSSRKVAARQPRREDAETRRRRRPKRRSRRMRWAALWPEAAITPPPGWVPAPHR